MWLILLQTGDERQSSPQRAEPRVVSEDGNWSLVVAESPTVDGPYALRGQMPIDGALHAFDCCRHLTAVCIVKGKEDKATR